MYDIPFFSLHYLTTYFSGADTHKKKFDASFPFNMQWNFSSSLWNNIQNGGREKTSKITQKKPIKIMLIGITWHSVVQTSHRLKFKILQMIIFAISYKKQNHPCWWLSSEPFEVAEWSDNNFFFCLLPHLFDVARGYCGEYEFKFSIFSALCATCDKETTTHTHSKDKWSHLGNLKRKHTQQMNNTTNSFGKSFSFFQFLMKFNIQLAEM